MQFLSNLGSLLASIRTPLTVSALAIIILYGIYRQVLRLPVFQPLGRKGTLTVINAILARVFWLALCALFLGAASFLFSKYIDAGDKPIASAPHLLDASHDKALTQHVLDQLLEPIRGNSRTVFHISAAASTDSEEVAAIDFKLSNNGRATAFLWKVSIDLLRAEIDQTPVVEFNYRTDRSKMTISMKNNGWGPADCDISISNEYLARLFGTDVLRFRGVVASNESKEIDLDLKQGDHRQMAAVEKLMRSREQEQQSATGPKVKITIMRVNDNALGAVMASGECYSANRTKLSINQAVLAPPNVVLTAISHGEFASRYEFPIYMLVPSEPTFVAVLDPTLVPSSKTYSLSRKIPPGDVERFYITLAASRSAQVWVRFRFFIDESTVLVTQAFSVKLWCPRDCMLHEADGTEFVYEDGAWRLPHPPRWFEPRR